MRRAPGIQRHPIRAPLRPSRFRIAHPHTKAIPSLKHSDLAYIPVPCRIDGFRHLRPKNDLRVTE